MRATENSSGVIPKYACKLSYTALHHQQKIQETITSLLIHSSSSLLYISHLLGASVLVYSDACHEADDQTGGTPFVSHNTTVSCSVSNASTSSDSLRGLPVHHSLRVGPIIAVHSEALALS